MDKFGRYEIIAEIARGGMAQVFHARDPEFDREVAIKALPREFLHDPQFRARFQREARALAALQHKAIVPVYDIGEHEGQPYLVMSYMSGGSLADRIEEGPLSLQETADIMGQIAPALDYAHQRGMIHRDIKPANILFDGFGDAHISDFGIVRLSEATYQLTGQGVLGTPAYMAPEMADAGDPTPSIDIYALGVNVYQMLSGNLPYDASTPMGQMAAHVTKPIPDIRASNPFLPPGIQRVIETALAKNPAERYASAADLSAALGDLLDGSEPTVEDAFTQAVTDYPVPGIGDRADDLHVSEPEASPVKAQATTAPQQMTPAMEAEVSQPEPKKTPTSTIVGRMLIFFVLTVGLAGCCVCIASGGGIFQ